MEFEDRIGEANGVAEANAGQENPDTAAGSAIEESQAQQPTGQGAEGAKIGEALTQERVDEIVRERLDRQSRSYLKKLGLESEDGIAELVKRAQSYDELTKENHGLKEAMALKDAGISQNREDDVRTYFKGKGMELTAESLGDALSTHPEWKAGNNVGIGVDKQPAAPAISEEEMAAKLFGYDKF